MSAPESIEQSLVKAGTDWADAQQVADVTEEAKKATFSAAVIRFKREGMSVSEAEHNARLDSEYKAAAESHAQAARDATAARVVYRAKEAKFEAWRTIEANHRAAARHST
ncbi:MAG: hypothetical protein V2I33_18275 [Kangiellaceae bacterium]|jgi:hypothetical protein|nr:hypothetical protein [Kangiellaceae bacterium]